MNPNRKFTAIHRLLHWIMAFAMPVLFITGFLRMYWMSKNSIIAAVEQNATGLNKDQLSSIVKLIRGPMWEWHELFAHVMIFSFIARIIYMLVKGIRFPNPFLKNQSLKERLQGLTYVYFYFFLAISAATGICIEKGFFSDYKENIESIHKWGVYWFPIFIVLHFGGIFLAERGMKRGMSSKMIGGD